MPKESDKKHFALHIEKCTVLRSSGTEIPWMYKRFNFASNPQRVSKQQSRREIDLDTNCGSEWRVASAVSS
jgi:hypothetical protein